ncbi:MAG: flagellar export protein FliJ [Tepidisphaeraceae bacterium]|jgi:flagellar FliJ protein
MAQFVFQLDGVLRHRTNVEHQCQRELAVIQGRMSALDAELRALDASVRASETDLRTNRLVGRLDLAFLAAHRRFAVAMQRKATEIAQKMSAVQVQLDRAKRNLAEAAKKRKIIEKLRERQLARWREQLQRRDVAEMDEIGMQLGHDRFAQAGAGAA